MQEKGDGQIDKPRTISPAPGAGGTGARQCACAQQTSFVFFYEASTVTVFFELNPVLYSHGPLRDIHTKIKK